MDRRELLYKITELEREIARLPAGSITVKKIKGKEYFYHRVVRDGKRTENYVDFADVSGLREQIEKRRQLEKERKELKALLSQEDIKKAKGSRKETGIQDVQEMHKRQDYRTTVRTGKRLAEQIAIAKTFQKRGCFEELRKYVSGPVRDKVFILYGLRRTGKTTMIYQCLLELPASEFKKAAFIQVRSQDTLSDLDLDLRKLELEGFRYVFIDEVTLPDDFVEGAALFSDIYANSGMKIVLSGTDSLGFMFSKEEQLYDRCLMLHTTFIPYHEFETVLGIKGIDEYIRYGGTMSISGVNYHEDAIFSSAERSNEYINTAIAKNIQHSLKMYQYGGHFRQLSELYEKGELTNVINRVVENINHSFTRSVVERTFYSHDISVTAANMLRDRIAPINLKEHLDVDVVTFGIRQALDILNKEEQTMRVDDSHLQQIKEYLILLDLVVEMDLLYLPDVKQKGKLTILSQPGMRYSQAEVIVENMLLDEKLKELSLPERKRILERLQSEIKGRMMEEIILLETKIANPKKQVFQLQFPIGEFDMVVFDPEELSCKIYEVKYSREKDPNQYRHLIDVEKCEMTAHRFGGITGKYVIYRGESTEVEENGIRYLNVEEYLNGLYEKC